MKITKKGRSSNYIIEKQLIWVELKMIERLKIQIKVVAQNWFWIKDQTLSKKE